MDGNRFVHVRHKCRQLIGLMLSMIRLHRVDFVSLSGVEFVHTASASATIGAQCNRSGAENDSPAAVRDARPAD